MLHVGTVDQLFAQGLQAHQAGQLPQAEALYRQILAMQPRHADALHLLGVLALQVKQYRPGIELIEKAIAINPRHPAYHSNLGEAYRYEGQMERALAEYRAALALDPGFGDAYVNLGTALSQMERKQEAAEAFAEGLRHVPQHAGLHRHLGDVQVQLKHWDAAIEAYRSAVRLDPRLTEAQFNLAVALGARGRPAEAAAAYAEVLRATPDDLDAHMGLAEALAAQNKLIEALQTYHAILQRRPDHAPAYAGMASIWRSGDRIDEAIPSYRKSLQIKPDQPTTMANLAFALRDYGQLEEAMELLRKALELAPDSPEIRSGYIFSMYLDPRIAPAEIEREKAKWNEIHVKPLARQPHANERSPGRKLQIGYVSADFRQHPVGRFMRPLLMHHDPAQVEVTCYSAVVKPDAVTAELMGRVSGGGAEGGVGGRWRQIAGMSEEQAAELVRRDEIDILVDLCVHTVDNRLKLFARKPAPVQMTYLAYCDGPGLETIDYRLTDRWIDPEDLEPAAGGGGGAGVDYEKPLRLETYWCYAAHEAAGEVQPLPALSRGYVTFGAFNYFSKVNARVLETWARLLNELPTARLVLHVPTGSRQEFVRAFFAGQGIGPERVDLVARTSEREYFARYGQVDVALDSFPFAGGTTTCDALWMGVPVVTLRWGEGGGGGGGGEGEHRPWSRGGTSILSTVGGGLEGLIATNIEDYVRIARDWAADVERLVETRRGLRQRMLRSPLMDAPRFARQMEAAFRTAWRTWCKVT